MGAVKRVVGSEAFFTAPELAQQCVEFVQRSFPIEDFDLIVEPSAGDGVFLRQLPQGRSIGIDVSPQGPDVLKADFLSWVPPREGRILVIGNPPFGQRAALAVRFIQHAATFADVIAFVLPRSFNKETFQFRVPLQFHLIDSFQPDLPFRTASGKATIKTVFQVWERGNNPRQHVRRPTSHPDFAMVHAHLSRTSDSALAQLRGASDFTIAQVGQDFRPRDAGSVTRGSHWFVTGRVPGVREVFARADYTFLADMNTAHTSLSRADIVQAYYQALDQ